MTLHKGFDRSRAIAYMTRVRNQSSAFKLTDVLAGNFRSLDTAVSSTEDGSSDTALVQIREARKCLQSLEEYAIRQGRAHGMTWTEVGRHLGISKQAAAKRFSHLDV